MLSTSLTCSGHGSRTASAPLACGFCVGCDCCQSHQIRSISAWCIQNMGSAGDIGTWVMVPLNQSCTRLCAPKGCAPSRASVKGMYVVWFTTVVRMVWEVGRVRARGSGLVPGLRVTVIGLPLASVTPLGLNLVIQ